MRIAFAVAATLLFVAGCGGGDDDDASSAILTSSDQVTTEQESSAEPEVATSGSESGSSATSVDTAAPDTAAPAVVTQEEDDPSSDDAALARAALLRLEDLPQGWAEDTSDGDDDEDDSACFGGVDPLIGDEEAAASAQFSKDMFSIIGVEISYTGSPDELNAIFDALKDDGVVDCLQAEMAADEESPGSMELKRLSVGDYGDDAAGLRIDLGSEGLGLVVDAVFVREGRALVGFSFMGVEDDLMEDVIETVIDRLEDT